MIRSCRELFHFFCFCFTQNVRRVALVTFNSAAHNKPSLIRDLLEQILPQLYNETKVRVSATLNLSIGEDFVLNISY